MSSLVRIFTVMALFVSMSSAAYAQSGGGMCAPETVKQRVKVYKKAVRNLPRFEERCVKLQDRWTNRANSYEQRANTYEDQRLRLLTDVNNINGTLGALQAIFQGIGCLTGILSPTECRNAEKEWNSAIARISKLERLILNIELKRSALLNKRDQEFAVYQTDMGRCQDLVATTQSTISELDNQLAGCRNVMIVTPTNNKLVRQSFNFRVKPQIVSVVPKGIVEPNAGYLVVIVDGGPVSAGAPVPMGAIELVGGETRARLDIPLPGPHSITVQLFNGDGTAFSPALYDDVNVTVQP